MIDGQSSVSGHDFDSDGSAIGVGGSCVMTSTSHFQGLQILPTGTSHAARPGSPLTTLDILCTYPEPRGAPGWGASRNNLCIGGLGMK